MRADDRGEQQTGLSDPLHPTASSSSLEPSQHSSNTACICNTESIVSSRPSRRLERMDSEQALGYFLLESQLDPEANIDLA